MSATTRNSVRLTLALPNFVINGGVANNNRQTFKFDELSEVLGSSNSEKFSNYLEKCLNAPYTHFNFGKDIIRNWALISPTKTALWSCEKDGHEYKITFKELLNYSSQFANTLTGKYYNLKPGNTVMVILPPVKEWFFIKLACLMSGIIFVPCSTTLTSNAIRSRLRASGADCVITDEANLEKITLATESPLRPILCGLIGTRHIPMPFRWMNLSLDASAASVQFNIFDSHASAPALRYFTSGTTGQPKIVQHSHMSAGLGHLTTSFWLNGEYDTDQSQLIWNTSNTGWTKSSCSSFFGPWLLGCGIFQKVIDESDPETILKTLETYPIETLCSNTPTYRLMTKHILMTNRKKLDKSYSLKQCVSAGETMDPAIHKLWYDYTNIPIREAYGQTETTAIAGTITSKDIRLNSMGKALPTVNLKIVNKQTLKEVATDIEGEIAIKIKPNKLMGLCNGYLNDQKRNKLAFIGDYYFTGDRARMDKDGYIFYTGRSDDMIKSIEYRNDLCETERILLAHSTVADCAITVCSDEQGEEVVKAFVVPTENYKQDSLSKRHLIQQLQTYVKRLIAPYKYPRQIELVTELPSQRAVNRNGMC